MVRLLKVLLLLALLALPQSLKALTVQESLAMLESGAVRATACSADRMHGNSGEVSRYQILPKVWRQYSQSTDYTNPEVAWSVAKRILDDRTAWFKQLTGREPTSLELYLLWNKPDHFRASGFIASKVNRTYRMRAERFSNLRQAGGTFLASNG